MVFGSDHYIYFDKFWKDASYPGTEKADSTEVTFFFVGEDENSTNAELIVVLAGRQLEHDLDFKLRVVPELTTALPEEYTLKDKYTFHARPVQEGDTRFQDTIQIQLNKSARLDTMSAGYRLVLEVVPDENVKPGQYERARSVIRIVKDPVRPEWWNSEVDIYLLGTYSATKYKLFLENVPGKGCFVAPQNRELLREAQLRRVEEKLTQAIEEARRGAVSLEELKEMLTELYQEV